MGGVGWERRTACNLVGGLLDLTGVFLATWDGIFVLEFGMISETETQGSRAGGVVGGRGGVVAAVEGGAGREGEGRREPGALWNSYKLASCSLASLCISLSTSPVPCTSFGRDFPN